MGSYMSQVSLVKRHVACDRELQHYPLNLSFSSLFKIEQPLEYKDDATDIFLKIYRHTLPRSVGKALSILSP